MCIYKMHQSSIVRKDEILSFATTWIDPKGITLNDINQMEKDKHHRISLICGLFKKKQRTDQSKHTVTESRAVVMVGGEDKCVKEADCTVTGGKYTFGGDDAAVYTKIKI